MACRLLHRRIRTWGSLLLAGGLVGACATAREVGEPPVITRAEADGVLEPGQAEGLGAATTQAMYRITSARDALEKQQVTRAQELLEASLADMDHVYTWLPEEPLYGAVDSAVAGLQGKGEVALGPLEARVRAREEYLPAGVVEDVEAARRLVAEGRRAEALQRLREVREVLREELLVLPVDEARERLRRARLALEAGRPGEARALLEGVEERLAQVRDFTPLVYTRWLTRASAEAAARGEWERAEELLRVATERLSRVREPVESPLVPLVERLEADARMLLGRMDGTQRPTPWQIQQLAERMDPPMGVGGAGVD